MLKSLSAKTHFVRTGVAVSYLGRVFSDVASTEVEFIDIDESEIIKYVDSGEPMDKAGAYAIQGIGAALVERTEGEFDTVVGFPSKLFLKMLSEIKE